MQWLQALKEDYVNFNKHETNEEAVLRCHYFSCYKGRLVIRKGGKRSASLGALFMTKHADADTLRHEVYQGHRNERRSRAGVSDSHGKNPELRRLFHGGCRA